MDFLEDYPTLEPEQKEHFQRVVTRLLSGAVLMIPSPSPSPPQVRARRSTYCVFSFSFTSFWISASMRVSMMRRWRAPGVRFCEGVCELEAYGVRRKPGLIRCAGSGALQVGAREYRLEDFVPVAHLPDAWAGAWVDALVHSGIRRITTIENEFPFLSYVEEAGGPGSLGARGEVAVYTAGFPTPALMSALADLNGRIGGAAFRHWGDADVGGLRIWWFLRCRLNRPVSLFCTTAQWVEAERPRGGRRLATSEIEALQRLKLQLNGASGEDIRSATELIDKLLEVQIRIEQERF